VYVGQRQLAARLEEPARERDRIATAGPPIDSDQHPAEHLDLLGS